MRLGSVEFEKRGAIALVTLDEPGKLNALSAGIREGVTASLARIEADPDIRVGIIIGSGEKAFCAGADISGFDFAADAVKQFIEEIVTFLASPESCSKPLIAAVNGMAFGGGFELAIACDFILASPAGRRAGHDRKDCRQAADGRAHGQILLQPWPRGRRSARRA